MGLYDEILCEYPLPGWPEGAEAVFQTKDLDCSMERYRISEDGRLLTTRYRRGEVAPTWELDTQYHGHLVFYTSVGVGEGREWFEYQAEFTDGRVVGLQRVAERVPSG